MLISKIFLFVIMVLSQQDVEQLIKKPNNGTLLREAVQEEKVLKALSTGEYADMLIDDFASLLVEERREKFRSTFGFHTAPILDKVNTHYKRLFDAQGRFIESKFSKPEQKQDFLAYLDKCFLADNGKLNGVDAEHFFREVGLNSILYEPNTVVYLDLPTSIDTKLEQRTTPTVQFVSVSKIYDIVATAKGIEYLIIYNEKRVPGSRRKNKQYFVIDDQKYMLFEKEEGGLNLVSEANHNFESCPAMHIATQNRYKSNYSIKQSPIWQSIDDLKAWLLLKNFAKVYAWESGVPAKFEPQRICTENHSSGVGCTNGVFILSEGRTTPCHTCARKSREKIAWGKNIEIPMDFLSKNGADLFFKTFQYADFSTDVMKFHEEDLSKKRGQIEEDLIGEKASQVKNARNETDVKSDTEDMKRILSDASETIESKWTWISERIAKARDYDSFISYTVFLGRGYLLQNKTQHQQEYNTLVQSGADDFVLNKKLEELIQSDYGYDTKFLELFEMLSAIIPFRHLPLEKVYQQQSVLSLNEHTKRDFYLRIYASNWIQEFLVLNDVQVWGKETSTQEKFDALRSYFSERIDGIISKDINII
jgi:hypothetical protein